VYPLFTSTADSSLEFAAACDHMHVDDASQHVAVASSQSKTYIFGSTFRLANLRLNGTVALNLHVQGSTDLLICSTDPTGKYLTTSLHSRTHPQVFGGSMMPVQVRLQHLLHGNACGAHQAVSADTICLCRH
jgi:hypothetical protein